MLKAQIQAALKKAGMPENLFGLIAVDTEDKIEAAVKILKDGLPANLLAFVGKLDKKDYTTPLDFISDLSAMAIQVESDRRVTEALAGKKKDSDDAAEAERLRLEKEKENKELTPDQIALKEMREAMAGFTDFIKDQKATAARNTRADQARAILKEKKLDAKWADRLDLSEGADLDGQVADLQELITGEKQEISNNNLGENPLSPEDPKYEVESSIEAAIVDGAKRKNDEDGTATKEK